MRMNPVGGGAEKTGEENRWGSTILQKEGTRRNQLNAGDGLKERYPQKKRDSEGNERTSPKKKKEQAPMPPAKTENRRGRKLYGHRTNEGYHTALTIYEKVRKKWQLNKNRNEDVRKKGKGRREGTGNRGTR